MNGSTHHLIRPFFFVDLKRPEAEAILLDQDATVIGGINIPLRAPEDWAGYCLHFVNATVTDGVTRTATQQVLDGNALRQQLRELPDFYKAVTLMLGEINLDTIAAAWLLQEAHKGAGWLMLGNEPTNRKRHQAMLDRLALITAGGTNPALATPLQLLRWYETMPELTLVALVAAVENWIQIGEEDEDPQVTFDEAVRLGRTGKDTIPLLWHAREQVTRDAH